MTDPKSLYFICFQIFTLCYLKADNNQDWSTYGGVIFVAITPNLRVLVFIPKTGVCERQGLWISVRISLLKCPTSQYPTLCIDGFQRLHISRTYNMLHAHVILTSIIIFGCKKMLSDRPERYFSSKGFKENINEIWLK